MKKLKSKKIIERLPDIIEYLPFIIVIAESVIEFIAVIVFAIVGRVFYSRHGAYPDPSDLIESFNSPDSIYNADDAFELLAESGLLLISLLAFVGKIVIAQVGLFRESVLRAVISVIADAGITVCLVISYLEFTEKIQINEMFYVLPMIVCFIVIFFTLKGTEFSVIPLIHIFQFLAEFIVVPLIITLTQYSLKTILGWAAAIIIGLAVLIGFLTGKSGSNAFSNSKSSASNREKIELKNKIDRERKKMSERNSNLAHGRGFATKEGVWKANNNSSKDIENWQKELDDLENE